MAAPTSWWKMDDRKFYFLHLQVFCEPQTFHWPSFDEQQDLQTYSQISHFLCGLCASHSTVDSEFCSPSFMDAKGWNIHLPKNTFYTQIDCSLPCTIHENWKSVFLFYTRWYGTCIYINCKYIVLHRQLSYYHPTCGYKYPSIAAL